MRRYLTEITIYLFILLFVYAAASKLLDYEKFRIQLGQSPLVTNVATILVWFVPCVEIMISVLLAIPRARLVGLYMAFSLMTGFTLYIIGIMYFSPYVPCSCGGVLQNMNWGQHLIFNTGFVILGAVTILFYEDEVQPLADGGI